MVAETNWGPTVVSGFITLVLVGGGGAIAWGALKQRFLDRLEQVERYHKENKENVEKWQQRSEDQLKETRGQVEKWQEKYESLARELGEKYNELNLKMERILAISETSVGIHKRTAKRGG